MATTIVQVAGQTGSGSFSGNSYVDLALDGGAVAPTVGNVLFAVVEGPQTSYGTFTKPANWVQLAEVYSGFARPRIVLFAHVVVLGDTKTGDKDGNKYRIGWSGATSTQFVLWEVSGVDVADMLDQVVTKNHGPIAQGTSVVVDATATLDARADNYHIVAISVGSNVTWGADDSNDATPGEWTNGFDEPAGSSSRVSVGAKATNDTASQVSGRAWSAGYTMLTVSLHAVINATTISAPVVPAIAPVTSHLASTVSLEAPGVTGADSFLWTQLDGPEDIEADIVDPTGAFTTVPATKPGVYHFQLAATNGGGTTEVVVQATVTTAQTSLAILVYDPDVADFV